MMRMLCKGPVSFIRPPIRVPGHSADAASPKASPGYCGMWRYISHRVTGMLRFIRSWPMSDKGMLHAKNAVRTAAAAMPAIAGFTTPSLSRTKPPVNLPRNTQSVRSTAGSAPVFQVNSAAVPPTARTATAAVSRTTETAALRTGLTRQQQKEFEAVDRALRSTRHLPDGKLRVKVVVMVYIRGTHTIDGASRNVHVSYMTAWRWTDTFIRTVGENLGCS